MHQQVVNSRRLRNLEHCWKESEQPAQLCCLICILGLLEYVYYFKRQWSSRSCLKDLDLSVWVTRSVLTVFCTHSHPFSCAGSETWRAGSWMPYVSSRLLPLLHGQRPEVKGHSGCFEFLTYSCLSTHFAFPPTWAASAPPCYHYLGRSILWAVTAQQFIRTE